MILGTGCDLAEVDRIRRALERKGFRERVFTPSEIEYCTGAQRDRAERYAARFAAKEAFLKALGTGLRGGWLQEISIERDGLGKPRIVLSGYFAQAAEKLGVEQIHLTLSHTQTAAMAVVILEGA